MNPQQQRAAEILSRLEAGALDMTTAAELLGVGVRQVRRLRVRFRTGGLGAVIHGNCGRLPANRTDPDLVERIQGLVGPNGKYHDLNVCQLQELLAQEEHIAIVARPWLPADTLRKSKPLVPHNRLDFSPPLRIITRPGPPFRPPTPHHRKEAAMKLIRVTAHSRVAAVAGAIAGIIRDDGGAEIQAIGGPAVNQMVKAVITARRYLSDEGVITSCEPSFVDLAIDGEERTAIRFTIAVVGTA